MRDHLYARMWELGLRGGSLPPHATNHVKGVYLRLVGGSSLEPSARRLTHEDLDTLERLTAAWERPALVHILHEGQTLCCAWPGKVPSEWPSGERWTSREEVGVATCPGCLDAFLRAVSAS